MSAHWYALHCKPHMEACVADHLSFHQIEYFYPTYPVRQTNPHSQKIKPLFPSYLFVQLELESIVGMIIKWMPGTVGLVNFDNEPAPVPDNLITAIRQRIQNLIINKRTSARFQHGETVQVMEGPLAGWRGIFDFNLPNCQRVKILLKILDKQNMRVELPAGHIEPIKQF